ncbi:Carbohydrate kinase PfkB [Dillenia turbinata]|uniref:Carbohydrate kinase PfkB n=1 Tax=Dillenia turbinata TaxID=194707 RepID=A0AAN8Z9B1_9MAGN
MVREQQQQHQKSDIMNHPRGLIVGNYCHDVLFRNEDIVAESLGGAASFISNVLDGLSISCNYVSKVGKDFAYSVSQPPIISQSSMTTLFHAHFLSERDSKGHRDRVLRRIQACDPIFPSDLPVSSHFDFGMAVGVGGEILPETLERMLDICNVVFVDIQALIRVFDPVDGTVNLVGLKESGFFHLLSRIGFLKASAEEAPYVDLEEARKYCYVVITNGKKGCTLYRKDEELQISPFPAVQIDPTGAGDSFLGGFVAGLNLGLAVEDATILGNFFGSLTVGYLGLPKFDPVLLQIVKDEVERSHNLGIGCCERTDDQKLMKSPGHERFHVALRAAKEMSMYPVQEGKWDMQSSPPRASENGIHQLYPWNGHQKSLLKSDHDGPLQSIERKP